MLGVRRARWAAITAAIVAGSGTAACAAEDTADEAALNLAVHAALIDLDDAPADGRLAIRVEFFEGKTPIQLGPATPVACNGVTLGWDGLGYAGRVVALVPGGAYAISRGPRAAVIELPAMARPAITAPEPGAVVTRSATFTIRYVADNGAYVRPIASGPSSTRNGVEQLDTGSATIDASEVGAGAGRVALLREVELLDFDHPYAVSRVRYTLGTSHPVTWR